MRGYHYSTSSPSPTPPQVTPPPASRHRKESAHFCGQGNKGIGYPGICHLEMVQGHLIASAFWEMEQETRAYCAPTNNKNIRILARHLAKETCVALAKKQKIKVRRRKKRVEHVGHFQVGCTYCIF
jgi:hypothetical protein